MELTVHKLIYGGDGLARMPSADPERAGKAVFAPFTIAGERVEARIVEEKPGFARARVEQVLQPSADRTAPGCPYFGECGGCRYQHMNYDAQLRAKASILSETLQRTAKLDPPEITAHPSPPWNYRNRTRLRVRTAPQFAIGYNRFASHALLPVRECPISSPLINRAIAALWKLGEAGRVPEAISEIEFFANAEDGELLLEITLMQSSRRLLRELGDFAAALSTEIPEVTGVVPFVSEAKGEQVRRIDVHGDLKHSFGRDSLLYRTAGMQYQVSAGSFFQTNRYLVDTMVSLATGGVSGDYALDLYSGVGLFALPLSQNFREVAAVEIAPFSFHDLNANAPSNLKGYRVAADKFLTEITRMSRTSANRELEDVVLDLSSPIDAEALILATSDAAKPTFDYIVVDPPRGGVGEYAASLLANLRAPRITYVSCDPATLARDLKVLGAAGYRIAGLHLLDLFPQTFHIETVTHLKLS